MENEIFELTILINVIIIIINDGIVFVRLSHRNPFIKEIIIINSGTNTRLTNHLREKDFLSYHLDQMYRTITYNSYSLQTLQELTEIT